MKLEITNKDRKFVYVKGIEENEDDIKFMEKYNNKEKEFMELPLHYRHDDDWNEMKERIFNLVAERFSPMGGVYFPENKIFKVPIIDIDEYNAITKKKKK